MKSKTSKVGLITFIGMTVALAASIRNIPDVAGSGWTMFFYMAVATLLFALPICLIAGEFGSAFPQKGGPELWVNNSLGQKFGFATSWLLWVQMFPGMVMVASALPPLLATAINQPKLGTNNIFTLIVILVVYWIITFLNMKFDMAKITGQVGSWLGIYIPLAIMTILGIIAVIKTGIHPTAILGHFSVDKLWPDPTDMKSLQFFSPIIFIFTGIEMSSVYITRLKKVSFYPIGVLVTLVFMFLLNTVNGFLEAAVVSPSAIDLNNIVQPVIIYDKILGLPSWIANVFSIMVFIGVSVQLSAWASGPGKTIVSSAQQGLYPPKFKFWKTDKFGDSHTILFTQATIISLFALVYLLIPAINTAFLDLVNATTVLYCIVYIFMAVGFIRLKIKEPNLKRPFKVGNLGMTWFIGLLLIATIIVALVATFAVGTWLNFIIVAVISIILTVLPFVIVHFHKDSWTQEVNELMAQQEKKN
ncbi:amino acid permease [Lactobacillus sp. PV037]|uniref:amino acid permease n=1 Tax=unclassified Lactobacillus TaxID=2620435 RepID=UPI002240C876|nr:MULTISPECIES: amino acid permease [unclassified Lactobacillus]QNQ82226.1 amino acid permease [Lactobacillus sp. PV012]QNQ83663.1 amino acid permease [Lactobacillus sp. PV037]